MTDSLRGFAVLCFGGALLAVALLAAAALGPPAARRPRAERRALLLQQRLESSQREAASAAAAAATVAAELKRLEAAVPFQRGDVELVDQLRAAARLAGATQVAVAPEGGVQVSSSPAEPKTRSAAKRGPTDLRSERISLAAEGRYLEFVALLGELSRLSRLQTVEGVLLVRHPPRVSWTLTLRAAHF